MSILDPREMAVISVGAIHAGNAPNVIAETAELRLTVRAFSPEVRALLREGTAPNVPDPALVESVPGDLRDAASVHRAAEGCDAIFHVGALYSFVAERPELQAINVGGTRNVLAAARAVGARLVHTSSISTIGGMRDNVLPDERQDAERAPGPYKESKWQAEQLVREEAARGLDAVIVNPTFPIGWGDVKPTHPAGCQAVFSSGELKAG